MSSIFLRGGESVIEENVIGFVVLNKEKEGVVSIEFRDDFYISYYYDGGSGGCGFCVFFVDFYKRFVYDFG